MIDLRLVREDPDAVKASQVARGEDPGLVDILVAADAARRSAVDGASQLRAQAKTASEAVRTASDKQVAVAAARELKEQVSAAEAGEREADAVLRAAHLMIPNVIGPGVPVGERQIFG